MTDKRATVASGLVFFRRSSAPLRAPRASDRHDPEAASTTLTTLAAVSSQMEKIAMTSMRQFVLAAGLLGLCAVAVELLTHGGSLAIPRTERTALRGERAAGHGELELSGARWGNGRIHFTRVELFNGQGRPTWILNTGDEVTIRLHFVSEEDFEAPVFAVDIHRFDGVYIGSINNCDTHPMALPIKRGEGSIELRLAHLDLPFNGYYLSLKAYTENGAPDWKDPADIHNQMYQFDVVTDRVIHGIMQFEAEWSQPKEVVQS